MNPTFDLLVSLAEIGGVFVGFGALIVLSQQVEEGSPEQHMVRQVVVIGNTYRSPVGKPTSQTGRFLAQLVAFNLRIRELIRAATGWAA